MSRPTDKRSEKYATSAFIMGISIDDLAFQLDGLGFECSWYNYFFNALADHMLIPMEDSLKYSGVGDTPPINLGEPKDDYDLPELQEYVFECSQLTQIWSCLFLSSEVNFPSLED